MQNVSTIRIVAEKHKSAMERGFTASNISFVVSGKELLDLNVDKLGEVSFG